MGRLWISMYQLSPGRSKGEICFIFLHLLRHDRRIDATSRQLQRQQRQRHQLQRHQLQLQLQLQFSPLP